MTLPSLSLMLILVFCRSQCTRTRCSRDTLRQSLLITHVRPMLVLLIAFTLYCCSVCVSDWTEETLTRLWNKIIDDSLVTSAKMPVVPANTAWMTPIRSPKLFLITTQWKAAVESWPWKYLVSHIASVHPPNKLQSVCHTHLLLISSLCLLCCLKIFRKWKLHPVLWIFLLSDTWRTFFFNGVGVFVIQQKKKKTCRHWSWFLKS